MNDQNSNSKSQISSAEDQNIIINDQKSNAANQISSVDNEKIVTHPTWRKKKILVQKKLFFHQ